MANEYDNLLTVTSEPKEVNEYDDILHDSVEEQTRRVERSLSIAVDKNPDTHAKILDLSERTGVQSRVVENQFEEVQRRTAFQGSEYDDLLRGDSPATARNFEDPDFAAIAQDDVERLTRIEQELAHPETYREKLQAAGFKGLAIVEASQIGMAAVDAELGIRDPLSVVEIARLADLERHMQFEDDSGFLAGIPIAAFEQLPILGKIIESGGKVGAIGAALGAVGGGLTTKTPQGAVAGAAVVGGLFFKAGSFGGAFELEGGLAFNQYVAEGIDRRTAAEAAVVVGAINGSLELVSLRLLGKTFKGAAPLIRKKVRQALTTEPGRQAVKRIVAAYLVSVAGEGITEGVQETVTILGEGFAKALDDENFDEATFSDAFDSVIDDLSKIPEGESQIAAAAEKGVQASILLASPGTVASATVQAREKKNGSEQDIEKIDRIIEASNESKLRERSPRRFSQLIEEMQEETGEISDIYITASEAQAWIVQEGIDIENPVNVAIETIVEQLPEALAAKGDVAVPIADFATYVAPSSNFETIRAHVKLRADALTADELSNFDKTVEERIKKLVADAQENIETQRQAEVVYEDVKQQLIATEQLTPENAAVAAKIIPAYVTTKAARTGLSVEEVYQRMGLSIVGPEVELTGDTLEQVIGSEEMRAKNLEKLRGERDELKLQFEEAVKERTNIIQFLATLSEQIKEPTFEDEIDIGGLEAIDINDDQALEQRFTQTLFRDLLPRNAVLRSEPGQESVIQRQQGEVATPKKLLEQVREIQARDDELSATIQELGRQERRLNQRVDTIFSGPKRTLRQTGIEPTSPVPARTGRLIDEVAFTDNLQETVKGIRKSDLEEIADIVGVSKSGSRRDIGLRIQKERRSRGQFKQDIRGQIQFDDDAQTAIIRLTESRDLSTFLHESGHLFLEMEARFFNDPAISDEAKADGQAILDWLGVSNFDSITDKHHEKWAKGFEAYLFDGKAPSAELRSTFRRFAAWLADVYSNLRQLNVKLTPEIIGVMDRMLATDEQIAEVQANLELEPLFKTAEEAGMEPKKFEEYKRKTQGAAEEELRTKILAELMRTTQKWWREELDNARDEVREEIEARSLYRAIAFMQEREVPEGFEENKMDRRTVYEMLGLAVPKDRKPDPTAVDETQDNLSEAMAKLGGLDREEAEKQGVDAAHWLPIKKTKIVEGRPVRRSVPNPENMPVGIGKPLFRKEGGKTFDGMRELLAELGYIDEDSTESDLLDKVLADLSGDTQYSTRVNLDSLFEDHSEATAERRKAPAQLRGLTKTGGAHPDTIAALFNFASGDELVRQIMESPTLTFAIEREAERVMLQRHGDILNDGTLDREATEAAHNTEQGSALIDELRALSGRTNVQAITELKAIKAAAARIIGAKRISSLRPAQYRSAEVKAAKEAQTALDAGDLETAQQAKQRQVFNFYLWREATRAREQANKIQARLRKMQTKTYRKNEAKPDYIAQMKQLLAVYDFRRSNQQARQQAQALLESVKGWLRDQQTDKDSPANVVDATMLDRVVHYRDMTLDQLTAVRDVATSLLFAGRKNSQAAKQVFNDQMKVVSENIDAKSTQTQALGIEDNVIRDTRKWTRAALAAHRKLESLVRQADAFEDLGPLWKLIIRPLLNANNKKLQMQEKAHDDLNDIFNDHEGLFNPFHDKRTFELESGSEITLSIGGRISLALNWGNAGNREAILNMEHNKLTQKDVDTILATLSDFDWDLVEGIWAYIDSFWPQIAELEKSFTGVVPRKVEALEYETASGRVISGGYYPLVADSALGFRANQEQIDQRAKRMAGGGTLRAATQHGHTIERVGFAGRDVDLSINVLFRHMDSVIHDISHRQEVSEVDRVLRNRNIARSLSNALGNQAYQAMLNQVTTVAAGHVHPKELGGIERMLRYMRLALTYGALGFSLKTGFSQMLGTGTAIGEFGAKVIAKGFIDFYSNPLEHEKFINEHSVFMRDRIATVNRDTSDILRNLKGTTALNKLRENAFIFLLAGDLAISRPVWWATYNEGLAKVGDPNNTNFNTEQDAIDFADRSVSRTQQSGLLMDLASIESKNEFVKMWTVMYSAFSAIYQIAVEQGKKYNLGKINRVQLAYNIAWVLIIPALFEELMTGRNDDDDEDDSIINNRWTKAVAGFSLATMAFLREIGWIMVSGQNSQLPVQKALAAPTRLWTQAQQGLEEKEIDAALINSITTTLSLLHIPGASQLNRSLNYLLAYEEGDEEHFDIWEFLITGPREDE